MWNRILMGKQQVARTHVVNYTIAPGTCPVGSWGAIHRMGLPHHGAPHTGRIHWVRAKLDLDGTVLAIWDWYDRSWVEAGKARMITRARNNKMEV